LFNSNILFIGIGKSIYAFVGKRCLDLKNIFNRDMEIINNTSTERNLNVVHINKV
jgi:hypothetical protein